NSAARRRRELEDTKLGPSLLGRQQAQMRSRSDGDSGRLGARRVEFRKRLTARGRRPCAVRRSWDEDRLRQVDERDVGGYLNRGHRDACGTVLRGCIERWRRKGRLRELE